VLKSTPCVCSTGNEWLKEYFLSVTAIVGTLVGSDIRLLYRVLLFALVWLPSGVCWEGLTSSCVVAFTVLGFWIFSSAFSSDLYGILLSCFLVGVLKLRNLL